MLEIKRATPDDAERAFEIRREAIRGQCIGAYSAEQMALWTRGHASDGYSVLMEKQFYMGWFNGKPVVTDMGNAFRVANAAQWQIAQQLAFGAQLHQAGRAVDHAKQRTRVRVERQPREVVGNTGHRPALDRRADAAWRPAVGDAVTAAGRGQPRARPRRPR